MRKQLLNNSHTCNTFQTSIPRPSNIETILQDNHQWSTDSFEQLHRAGMLLIELQAFDCHSNTVASEYENRQINEELNGKSIDVRSMSNLSKGLSNLLGWLSKPFSFQGCVTMSWPRTHGLPTQACRDYHCRFPPASLRLFLAGSPTAQGDGWQVTVEDT